MGKYVILNGVKTLRAEASNKCDEQKEQRTRFTDYENRCSRISECPYKVSQIDGRGNMYFSCGKSYKY